MKAQEAILEEYVFAKDFPLSLPEGKVADKHMPALEKIFGKKVIGYFGGTLYHAGENYFTSRDHYQKWKHEHVRSSAKTAKE